MLYLYKIEDGPPKLSTEDLGSVDEFGNDLELILAAKDIEEVINYMRSYYDYSVVEVEKYLEFFDISI